MTDATCNYMALHLSRPSKKDGRLLLLVLLIVYFLPILISSSNNYEQWYSPWIYPGVPKMLPPFADMRVITSGYECIRLGYDALIENPCDPWNRRSNYPRIWSVPVSLGLDQSHTVFLGILCGLLFFVSTFVIIGRLNYIEALIYALILCSPAVMFAVERGNNDLITFTVLSISVLIMSSQSLVWRLVSYVMILLAAILKLFPIFAFTTIIKEKRRNFTIITAFMLMSFIIYSICTFEDLKLISRATPRQTMISYGGRVIFDVIFNKLRIYSPDPWNFDIANIGSIAFVVSVLFIFVMSYLSAMRSDSLYRNELNKLSYKYIDSFRLGASIYVGTYLLGNNWDYRLIFLLFTAPQILAWVKSRGRLSLISGLALTGIILTLWLSEYSYYKVYEHYEELINWLLFFYFIYTLILTLPRWLKGYIALLPHVKSTTVEKGTGTASTVQSDRVARAFVWSVWLVMILVALACLVKYGRNIPFSEDWFLVSPLTGNEPNLISWLWAQNNEHRIPFPRLILLALLKVTHGDFRVGMLFNITILGALALAMVRVARRVRGGRTSFADAFFPITLFHLGNWENLFWSWQLTQVVPMVLTCVILLVLVGSRTFATPGAAVVAGISLVLLPLSGANGLIFVPILALWLGYCGVLHWRAEKTKREQRWIGGFLIGSVAVAIFLTGLYFVGYERPALRPPNPGPGASLKAALQFLALGFGPIARSSWTLSMMATIGVLLSSAILVILGVLRHKGQERDRALGMLAFLGGVAVFALAMGWGRAAVIPLYVIWPIRYVLFAIPALFAAFFIWELYGPTKIRSIVQYGLFLGMFLLIPFNTVQGFWWRDQYREGMESLEQDLVARIPCSILAERQQAFLLHWLEPSYLADRMRMLHEAGIGLFGRMQEDSIKSEDSIQNVTFAQAQPQAQSPVSAVDIPLVSQEIRYHMPEAGEVYLVWGLNGWHVAPEELRPAGTEVKDNVMHTPMVQKDDAFVAKVAVPAGTAIDYCFRITKKRGSFDITWPVCDGHYRETLSENSVTEVETDLTLALVSQEIRYRMPEAGEVFLIWGLNGWHVAPEELRPAGTEVKNNVMHTPMVRQGDTFVAKVWVPAGTTVDYCFLSTKRRGLFDIVYPVCDGGDQGDQMIASEDGVTEVNAAVTLARDLWDALDNGLYFLAGAGVLLCTWLAAFFVLGFVDG